MSVLPTPTPAPSSAPTPRDALKTFATTAAAAAATFVGPLSSASPTGDQFLEVLGEWVDPASCGGRPVELAGEVAGALAASGWAPEGSPDPGVTLYMMEQPFPGQRAMLRALLLVDGAYLVGGGVSTSGRVTVRFRLSEALRVVFAAAAVAHVELREARSQVLVVDADLLPADGAVRCGASS